jgi:hypothetical protein
MRSSYDLQNHMQIFLSLLNSLGYFVGVFVGVINLEIYLGFALILLYGVSVTVWLDILARKLVWRFLRVFSVEMGVPW